MNGAVETPAPQSALRLSRVLARSVSEMWALGRLLAPCRRGFRVLMYHAVGTQAAGDTLGIFSIDLDLFAAHMEALQVFPGARVVGLDGEARAEVRMPVAISFDDGYRDNLEVAAPILQGLRFPFTVFVTTDYVRSGKAPFLNADALRRLADVPGATIGAHGATHVPLTRCDDRTLREELIGSKQYLEDVIGRRVNALAYPHGAVDARVRDMAERAGFEVGATSRFDINGEDRDPLLLARTSILRTDDLRAFRQKLHGDWDWYRWRTKAAA